MDQNPQIKSALKQLRAHKSTGKTIDQCILAVRELLETVGADKPAMDALDQAGKSFRAEFARHEVLHPNTVVEAHEQWYTGPSEDARHWPALKVFLRDSAGRDDDMLKELNDRSNEIVSLLGNPISDKSFRRRGLVIGHVQSGKTENMTAVIAKAVDAGYNLVIVLAGLTEKLRQQTQARFERDLVSHHAGSWRLHTSTSDGGDFSIPRDGSFVVHDRVVHLLVLKKTTLTGRVAGDFRGPLGKLEETLRSTPPNTLKRLRALIIDDECDQATVNSAMGDMDVSVINDCIRRVLHHLPFHTYVGYTATPFANVLINPWPHDRSQLDSQQIDDLYPKSFITALPRQLAYFGAEQLFGNVAEISDSDETIQDGLPFIRDILDTEEELLQPPSREGRLDFWPQMPSSLEDGVLYFLACCAARCQRGHVEEHMTMLVHTSMYRDMHNRVSSMIEDWTVQQRSGLLDRSSAISKRMMRLYDSEQNRTEGLFKKLEKVRFDSVFVHLPEVISSLEFVIENGDSDDRLDYSGKPRRYIVTGGSILARGLTLNGLMVSYFLRSSSQFDTLLQMGRWFGYRVGYEDQPRIWTTLDLQEKFAELAAVETHIRADIARYKQSELTPLELAVRIPRIPGMAITGAAKMKHALRARVSYFGREEQTTRFYHRDISVVNKNWQAAAELVQRLNDLGCRDHTMDKSVWRRAPVSSIRRFIRSYTPHNVQKTLDSGLLESFLDSAEKADLLLNWNVAIVATQRNAERHLGMLGPEEVSLSNRSKMHGGRTDAAWLKALLSARDCLLDVPPSSLPTPLPTKWGEVRLLRAEVQPGIPLLLLYPINADSKAESKNPRSERVDLNAVDNLLGYGLVFPSSSGDEPDLVEVDVQPPLAEDPAEVAELEQQMAAKAGSELIDEP